MVDQTQEATLFLAIFTIWMSFLYIRVFDKKVKKYIFSIGVLLVFWMTTKIVKIKTTGTLESIMWYLYYIPMIFIPTLYYGCSEYLAKTKGISLFPLLPKMSANRRNAKNTAPCCRSQNRW